MLFNLLSRSRFGGRLECFYEEGRNEWYLGFISLMKHGFAVHFGENEFPPPPGYTNFKLPEVISKEETREAAAVEKELGFLPKKRSKFASWCQKKTELGFVSRSE